MRARMVVAALSGVLLLGVGALGCPLMHDSYPTSGGTCRNANDCFAGEACSDGGVCEPAAEDGGTGTSDAPSDGGQRG